MARRVLIAALLLASSVLLARSLGAAASLRADAPFVALASGHAGLAYSDGASDIFQAAFPAAKAPFANYRVTAGSLPAGLSIDAATGTVSGTPFVASAGTLRLAATDASGTDYFVRAELAVFSKNDAEIVPGQSFLARGPYTVSQRSNPLSWVSSFDQATYQGNAMIFQPALPAGTKAPVLAFHHGRGLTWTDYVDFLTHVASYGVVCASIDDVQSFEDSGNPGAASFEYDVSRPETGMESASAAQEGLVDYLLGLSQTPSDPLYGAIDPESVFISGHSRGGGATHGSHVRSLPLRAKGVIYFMAFDLRYFTQCVPPGQAPAYGIPDVQPRLPSLVISAENDADLVYPYADEFIDRSSGPTTFATVYGACHDLLADTHPPEGNATITRQEEHDRIAHLVVAFIKRWANEDVTLEGQLYGNELATSSQYAIASWRRASPLLMVDDFQGADPAHNLLGGTNGAAGCTRSVQSVYPALGDLGSLGIKHSILQFTQATASFDLDLNGARDVRRKRSLLVRVMQTGTQGWNVDGWAVLHDTHGNTASVQFAKSDGTTTGFLPGWTSGGSNLSRFLTLNVPLYRFERAKGALDLGAIDRVSFTFGAVPGTSPEVALDDVRFE